MTQPNKTITKRSGLVAPFRMPAFPGSAPEPAEAQRSVPEHLKDLRVGDGGGLLIPIHLIDRSPYQNRTRIDEEHVRNLKDSISSGVMLEAIVVRSKPDGRFELIAGEHRLEASKLAGKEDIEGVVRDCDDAIAAKYVLVDNLLHRGLTDYEVHLGLVKFRSMSEGDVTVRDLAQEVGCSTGQVQRYLSFRRLPKEAHDLLRQQPTLIGGAVAEAIAKYAEENAPLVVEALERIATGELQQGRAEAWIQHRLAGAAPQAAAPARVERIIQSRSGKPACKVVRDDKQIRISLLAEGRGLNLEEIENRLAALIEAAVEAAADGSSVD